MPILTQNEFETLLGEAGQVVSDPAAWSLAYQEAEHLIATRGRLVVPSDPAEAPAWAKLAATWLIYYTLIARAQPVQPELLEDARRRREMALRVIEEEGARATTGTYGDPLFGEMEGLYEW